MTRMITVKGTGNLRIKPDFIIIKLEIESQHDIYEKTMALAAENVKRLHGALTAAGFEKKDLKTTDFQVNTHYESFRDIDDNYRRRFAGYICSQTLSLGFDFDTNLLAEVLTAIAKAAVHPKLDIRFSVKDKDAVNEKLLTAAVVNARGKAEILAKASGVRLGEIQRIDYNWGELHLYSPTDYFVENKLLAGSAPLAPDIEPEDISVSDTVTLIWALV